MLSPLEYLLFNINMVFLADSYFNAHLIKRAAMSMPETLPLIQTMMEIQQMILVFFAIKLCLTVSDYLSLELNWDEDQSSLAADC